MQFEIKFKGRDITAQGNWSVEVKNPKKTSVNLPRKFENVKEMEIRVIQVNPT